MAQPNGAPAPTEPGASLFDYGAVLLRHRRLIVLVPLLAALATAAISLVLPTKWEANASFVPAATSKSSLSAGLGAIAGQFGIALGGENLAESPQFYVDLAGSRGIREALLDSRFPKPGSPSDSAALIDILGVTGETALIRREKAVAIVRRMVAASTSRTTGIVAISVTAPDPGLAAAIANRTVALLNRFNREKRTSQAGERRRFVQARLAEAETDLNHAEDELRSFLTRNRQHETPALQFEYGRLQRQVQVRQEVYLTLRREFETARIEEVNNTPVLSVVDAAVPPASRSAPARTRMTVIAGLLAAVVATLAAFAAEMFDGLKNRDAAAYSRFRALWPGNRRSDS